MNRFAVIALLLIVIGGCYNPDKRVDERSALEQQLTRTAIVRSIDQLAIHKVVLQGTWKVTVSAPEPKDRDWIRNYVQRRLVSVGAKISRDEEAELPLVEVDVVYSGSDIDNFYVGLPISLPGTMTTISFYQSIKERGRARIGLTFWSEDNTLLAQTPDVVATAHYTNYFILTLIGPFGVTDLDHFKISGRFQDLSLGTWDQIKHAGEWILPIGENAPDAQPKN